jgi:hypothetical protein
MNQASVWSEVVPVFPATSQPSTWAFVAVPRSTTPRSTSRVTKAAEGDTRPAVRGLSGSQTVVPSASSIRDTTVVGTWFPRLARVAMPGGEVERRHAECAATDRDLHVEGTGERTPIAPARPATRSRPTSTPRRANAVLTEARVASVREIPG